MPTAPEPWEAPTTIDIFDGLGGVGGGFVAVVGVGGTTTDGVGGGGGDGTADRAGGAGGGGGGAGGSGQVNGVVKAGGQGSNGGSGGAGATAFFAVSGAPLVLPAAVVGGAGGFDLGSTGPKGADGAGVEGANLWIVDSGAITGGGATGDAIDFLGGDNLLTLNVGASLTGAIALDNGSMLTIDQAVSGFGNFTLNNAVTGDGALTVNLGAHLLTLGGANTFSGGTTLNGGVLALASGAALGTGDLTFAGTASVLSAGAAVQIAGPVSVAAGAAATFGAVSGVLTLNGAINATSNGQTVHFGTAAATGEVVLNTLTDFLDADAFFVDAGAVTLGAWDELLFVRAISVGAGANAATLNLGGITGELYNLSGAAGGVVRENVIGAPMTLTVNQSADGTFAGTFADQGAAGALTLSLSNLPPSSP